MATTANKEVGQRQHEVDFQLHLKNSFHKQQQQGLDEGSSHSMASTSFADDEKGDELEMGYLNDHHQQQQRHESVDDGPTEDDSFPIIPSSSRHTTGSRSHHMSAVYLPKLQSLAQRSHPLQYSKQNLKRTVNDGSNNNNNKNVDPSEPLPTADATVCRPDVDSPSQLQAAQLAGRAARERFDRLVSSSQLPSDHSSSILLLSWDEVFVEDLLGVGGFACVCLVTCDTLWRKHKRQYLQRKWNNSQNGCSSDDLDSLDSSLLPPSEDSWMSMSVETNEEKYYACKCLSNATIQSKDQKRFANAAADLVGEAFLLSKLCHPNIIRLYGVTGGQVDQAFQATGGFFLVMEALTSVLDDMIQVWRKDDVSSMGDFLLKNNESVPSMDERLTIGVEIAKGMQYLHQNRVIFRDLKPANIGIDREGGIRIFDFGLARECLSGVCGGKAGSMRYMAPETFQNQFCCFASDVYSFGISLWELVSLVRPPKWASPEEIEKAVCVHGYRPDVSCIEDQAVKQLMMSCWNDDYQQRPTFDRILASMQNIIDNNRIMKRRARRTSSRHNSGLDGGSNHSMGPESAHSIGSFAIFDASFQSLMNDSVVTEASFSKLSASGRFNRPNRKGSSFSAQDALAPLPQQPNHHPAAASRMSDTGMSPPPPPPRIPVRPPKTLKEAPPSKNESETTITMSNVAAHRRAGRKSAQSHDARNASNDIEPSDPDQSIPYIICSTESMNIQAEVSPQPGTTSFHEQISLLKATADSPVSVTSAGNPKSIGEQDCEYHMKLKGDDESPGNRRASLGSNASGAEASSSHSRASMGSNTSGASTGSGNGPIKWQRKKKPERRPKDLTNGQSSRSKSEPLSNLMDVMSRK